MCPFQDVLVSNHLSKTILPPVRSTPPLRLPSSSSPPASTSSSPTLSRSCSSSATSPQRSSLLSSSESSPLSPSTSSSVSLLTSLSPSSSSATSSPAAPTASLRVNTHIVVMNLVAGLATKGITVTEWGSILYGRLGLPLTLVDFDFLVDDDLLEAACSFIEEQGHRPIGNRSILSRTTGEFETIARHFDCYGQRLNLYPGSFAGFRANELSEVPLDLDRGQPMPVSVLTTRPAPLVASLVRLISRVHYNDPLSTFAKCELSQVICYLLSDMSYEGDYMELGGETQEETDRAISCAVESFRKWEGWRDDEIWIADAVEAIIQAQGEYHYLPSTPFKNSR